MSSIGAINNSSYYPTAKADSTAKTSEKESTEKAAENKQQTDGVVYEKGSSTKNTEYVKKNSALIEKLKADSETRVQQMRTLVEQMMSKQGAAVGKANDMWRIVDFAKALSGNDPAKADKMIEAFKKGFQQATGSWGKKLPDISQRTYDAVMEKFDAWKNGTEKAEETNNSTEA